MPKSILDYSKCIIYKIVCIDFNIKDVYVGHTTDFTKRKYQHKLNCSPPKYINMKIFKVINENGGWENLSIVLAEEFRECNNSNEARPCERHWFE